MTDDYSYKEIELFIREELSQHGEWLVDRLADAIERGGHIDTGALLDSLNYTTSTVNTDGSVGMTVAFNTYGRLAEIMSSRRRKRLKEQKKNGEVWAKRNHRPKRVQWYNRNRYAGYGRLVARIAAGMSDDERRRILGILQEAEKKWQ